MKIVKTNFLFLAVMVWLAGCAILMPSIAHHRDGNQIIYTHKATGGAVAVNIAPPFEYQKIIQRRHKGVTINGYLFSDHTDSILVTRIHHRDFEKLTGIRIPVETPGHSDFPPKTIYAQKLCELIRTYTRALSEYIVVAAYIKNLDTKEYGCEAWDTIDDVAATQPALLEKFNEAGDQRVTISRRSFPPHPGRLLK